MNMEPTDNSEPQITIPTSTRKKKFSFRFFILLAALVAISAAATYFMSVQNHNEFRLSSFENQLIVERGLFMPMGFKPYTPTSANLRNIYLPIQLPQNNKQVLTETFSDRTDLDHAIFGVLSGWSRDLLESTNKTEIELVKQYLNRCELLPGITEEQQREISTLRADLAFKKGLLSLTNISEQLQNALSQMQLAIELGTSFLSEAEKWVVEIQNRIQLYQIAPMTPPDHPKTPPLPQKTPSFLDYMFPKKWRL